MQLGGPLIMVWIFCGIMGFCDLADGFVLHGLLWLIPFLATIVFIYYVIANQKEPN